MARQAFCALLFVGAGAAALSVVVPRLLRLPDVPGVSSGRRLWEWPSWSASLADGSEQDNPFGRNRPASPSREREVEIRSTPSRPEDDNAGDSTDGSLRGKGRSGGGIKKTKRSRAGGGVPTKSGAEKVQKAPHKDPIGSGVTAKLTERNTLASRALRVPVYLKFHKVGSALRRGDRVWLTAPPIWKYVIAALT